MRKIYYMAAFPLAILLLLQLAINSFIIQGTALQESSNKASANNPLILMTDGKPNPFKVPPPSNFLRNRQNLNGVMATPTATFSVTYTGFTTQAQAAFQYALDIWATQITSPVPIVIDATWTNLQTCSANDACILGSAGINYIHYGFTGATSANTWYGDALADKLHGSDNNPGYADIYAEFNSGYPSWYYGTDGNTPGTLIDFTSVVMHEVGHGLGFYGGMDYNSGSGSYGFGVSPNYPIIYDRFVVNGSGQSLVNTGLFPNPSVALGSQLVSNNIYFDSPTVKEINGGNRVKLYAPTTWVSGTSYSHVDDIYNNTSNSLMTYSIGTGESQHNPGPIMLAMFKDMGWTVALAPKAPTVLAASPISSTRIDLTWHDNSDNETGFRVERSPNGSTSWTSLTTLAANTTSYSDTGLTPNTAYYYRVLATNNGTDSDYSNTANATTLANNVPINVPMIQQGPAFAAADGSASDWFGGAVALSSDGMTALIGAKNKMVNNQVNQGVAYVYKWNGSTWIQQGPELVASDGAASDSFGWSVALSGDGKTALIGAKNKTYTEPIFPYIRHFQQGEAYFFNWNGSTWVQQGDPIIMPDGINEVEDYFGTAVSLSSDGTTAIISAPRKSVNKGLGNGAVYAYIRNGTTWSQQGAPMVASDTSWADGFGESVALSSDGKTALIGAPYKHAYKGEAYIFTRNGTTWSQQGEGLVSNTLGMDQFGTAVSLSGDGTTAFISAPKKTINYKSFQGAMYVYKKNGTTWSQLGAALVDPNGQVAEIFGKSVAVSSDGTTAIIGAAFPVGKAGGAVFVYKWNGTSWDQNGSALVASDSMLFDEFGAAVALSSDGTVALIGNPSRNQSQGVIYRFSKAITNLTVSPIFGSYGGTVNLTATLNSGGSGVNGKSISFKLNGASVGTAITNASGVATLNTISLSGIATGAYPTGLSASFAGDDSYQSSSDTTVLAVINATWTVNNNQDYGSSSTVNSLTWALTSAQSGDAIMFNSTLTSVTANAQLPKMRPGVQILGRCSNGPEVTITGKGTTSDGLKLTGGNFLYGIRIANFAGVQIQAIVTDGASANKLTCTESKQS
ncbi:fibronectin type III domain-containing protein [Candidatus Chlorohelix sp.]|uniref:fibronectin type III domain-containing protein n=1 Tax=Candidatus Chlorohelix sp. TaxID=3139201 RepID=UPI0030671E13